MSVLLEDSGWSAVVVEDEDGARVVDDAIGVPGPPGPPGPSGPAGPAPIIGHGPPAVVGSPGQAYIDADTGDLYEYTTINNQQSRR